MFIEKKYHFYAAHRNQTLQGSPCSNIHGHTYKVRFRFRVFRDPSNYHVTTLFHEFDDRIGAMLYEKYDHRLLIDKDDPLYVGMSNNGHQMAVFPYPTSVENIAFALFDEVMALGFSDKTNNLGVLEKLYLKETESSTLIYSLSDWIEDSRFLQSRVKR